jgi:hypothetical protein
VTTVRSAPLIPRWAITLVTFALLALMGVAVSRGDYLTLVILSLVLFFILGADVAAMVRAWRGVPDQPGREPRS